MAVLKTTSPWPRTSAPIASPTNERPSSRTSAANGLSLKDHRLVEPVLLLQEDLNALALRSGHVLAHVVGPDRELAMAAVGQHRELDRARASVLEQRVERRAHRPSVVYDVVHQHHRQTVD